MSQEHKDTFRRRTIITFILTALFVWVAIYLADNFGQARTVNIFTLTLVVLQSIGDLTDPRQIREKRAMIPIQGEEIEKLRADVSFLKYVMQKELDMEFGELHLQSSIWRDLGLEEEEHADKESDKE